MRKADELSITIAPAASAAGANSRLRVAPALKKAMSTPLKESAVSSSTLYGLAFELQGLAGRALGGQQLQAGDGEVPALQDAQDFDADGAGGADNGNVLGPHDTYFRLAISLAGILSGPMMANNKNGPNGPR